MRLTEVQFQRQVVDIAKLCGWRVYHPFLSKWSDKGWPDLFMVRGDRAVALELKSAKGKTSAAQEDWIESLGAVEGIVARIVQPGDWAWIEGLLR